MEEDPFESFGGLLQYHRKSKRLTQRQLAAKLGVHHNTVSFWERGNFLPETSTIVLEIARQLDLSEEERRRLLEASLTALSPYWYMPYQRNPFFMGRQTVLHHIYQMIGRQQTTDFSRSYALTGLGGIGKTQVAIEYVYHHFQEYTAVFWFAAETAESLTSSFSGVAHQLQLFGKGEREQERVIAGVLQWLNTHHGWLLVFDNVEDPEMLLHFLPSARSGSLLFTTRLPDLASLAACVELEPLTQEEGVRFLLRRSGLHSPQATFWISPTRLKATAQKIVTLMDGLPLALDQAGAYIGEAQCSLEDFLQLYQSSPLQLLQGNAPSLHHPLSVEGTFTLAFERLRKRRPGAAQLLTLFCFMAPDEIPETLFSSDFSRLNAFLSSPLGDLHHWNALLRDLLAYALIRRNRHTKTITVHRLVQIVLKERLAEKQQQIWVLHIIELLNQAFLLECQHGSVERQYGNMEQWSWCEQLLPHVLLLIDQGEQWQCSSPAFCTLLTKTATYYLQRVQFLKAEAYYLKALAHMEALPEKDDTELAMLLTGLAEAYHQQGKHQEAEKIYKRALATLEEHVNQEQVARIFPLQGLGYLYYDMAKLEEAESAYRQAIEICEKELHPDHPQIVNALNGLADLYSNMGRYQEAEEFYLRMMRIYEEAQTTQYYERSEALNGLAILYVREGRYKEAEQLYQQALRLGEEHLGADHPSAAATINNLAGLYRRQGKYQQAEALYTQALHLRTAAYGEEHPYVAFFQNNLALIYHLQGRDEEAKALASRSLQTYEYTLDANHPTVATTLNTLAQIATTQGHFAEAEAIYLRALSLCEQALKPYDPNTAVTLHHLGDLYRKLGRYQEAEALYTRALRIREQILTPEHPDMAALLVSMAPLSALSGQADHMAQAQMVLHRALSVLEAHVEPQHLAIAEALQALGDLSCQQDRHREARAFYLRALRIRKQTLPPCHPEITALMADLKRLRVCFLAERSQQA